MIEKALAVLTKHGINPDFLNQKLQDSAEEYNITSGKEIYDNEKLDADFALVQDELDSFYPTQDGGEISFLLERFIEYYRYELIEDSLI